MVSVSISAGHDVSPVTWSCRLVYWVSYITAMVLFSAYSGALVSSLANQHTVPPFDTFEGILRNGRYKVTTVADSSHLATFQVSTWRFHIMQINEQLNYRERKTRRNMLTTNPMQGQVRCCQIWGRRRKREENHMSGP